MELMTDKQRSFLTSLLREKEITEEEFLSAIGEPSSLTKQNAQMVIDVLMHSPNPKEDLKQLGLHVKYDEEEIRGMANKGKAKSDTNSNSTEIIESTQSTPKNKMVIGDVNKLAETYGLPKEIASMFFMTINDTLYIRHPGLLYIAKKRGYTRILTQSHYDKDHNEWVGTCYIYPVIPVEVLEALKGVDPQVQLMIIKEYYGPTYAEGRASERNVINRRMHMWLKEMAETRAEVRALRRFSGYGGTAFEELPEAEIPVE